MSPGFCNGSFAHSVDTTSAGVGLESPRSVPEALIQKSAKRKGRARGRLKPENRFWRFRGLRGHAVSSDMSASQEMVCPGFSNGSFANSVHTWLPGAASRLSEGGCRKR